MREGWPARSRSCWSRRRRRCGHGWTLTWTFGGNQQISNMWNAVRTQTGQSVSAGDAGWNRTIAAAGTAAFGFQASFSGTNARPTAFRLNGTACAVV